MELKNNKFSLSPKNFIACKIFVLVFISFCFFGIKNKRKNFIQDDITLVTCLYQIDTNRHKHEEYLIWVENLLQINRPIIFFIQPNISKIIKEKRPKEYQNKTIWIEKNFCSLYSYKHYLKQFKETYIIDKAKYKHTVDLYIIWSEKMNFLKESIEKNYFKSKYFFWVDAGLFQKENMEKYINNWPSIDKIKNDSRVILNGIREIKKEELDKLMNFDNITHDKFMNDFNVAGGFFGGRSDYIIKFIKYYYEILELFYNHKKYIGTDQNIFAIVGYLHPEIVKIINAGYYEFLKNYFVSN